MANVPESTRSTVPAGTVAVPIDELAAGQRLTAPIFDSNGVLLLAGGSTVTQTFKRLLQSHGIGQVYLSRDDARPAIPSARTEPARNINPRQIERLDRMLDGPSLVVRNNGPAAQRSATVLGCRPYDPVQRQRLGQHFQANLRLLDRLLSDALAGQKLTVKDVSTVSNHCLAELMADSDNVLTTAADIGQDLVLMQYCLQLSLLGMAIGMELGYDSKSIRDLGLCGLMHDWGMIRVPPEIRCAERPLSEAETLEIKRHPIYSVELLECVSGIHPVVSLVCYQVHEKPNGFGFPRGRTSKTIHPFAKALHVADAYLSLTQPGPNREPVLPYRAMAYLLRQVQQAALDGASVRALLHVLSLFPLGSYVRLSDGSSAQVIRRNGSHYTKPIVGVFRTDAGTRQVPEHHLVDLAHSNLTIERPLATAD